jgi:hypothetical protein
MPYTITTKPEEVGAMPNQIYGTLNGRTVYFRARHGEWTLRFYDPVNFDEPPIASGGGEPLGPYGELPGWWRPVDALAFCEKLLRELDRSGKECE